MRTIVLSPRATDAASGAALVNALAGITTASVSARWLIKLEPGRYDLGATALTLKPYVDLEGSGELASVITVSDVPVAVLNAANVELRNLSFFFTRTPVGVENNGVGLRLTQMAISTSGTGTSLALSVTGTGSVVARQVRIGVNTDGAGVNVAGDGAFEQSGVSIQGPTTVRAMVSSGTLILRGSTLTAYTSSGSATGLLVTGGTAELRETTVSGTTGSGPASYGILASSGSTELHACKVVGGTNSLSLQFSAFPPAMKVATSQLVGPVGGAPICVFDYNGTNQALNSACQVP